MLLLRSSLTTGGPHVVRSPLSGRAERWTISSTPSRSDKHPLTGANSGEVLPVISLWSRRCGCCGNECANHWRPWDAPPSIGIAAPVMNLALSEQRNAATLPKSSGSPIV